MREKFDADDGKNILRASIQQLLKRREQDRDFSGLNRDYKSRAETFAAGFNELRLLATLAHMTKANTSFWESKIRSEREKQLEYYASDPDAEKIAAAINELFATYLMHIGEFVEARSVATSITSEADADRVLLDLAVALTRRGEQEVVNEILDEVHLVGQSWKYFNDIRRFYEKNDNRPGLHTLLAQMERVVELTNYYYPDLDDEGFDYTGEKDPIKADRQALEQSIREVRAFLEGKPTPGRIAKENESVREMERRMALIKEMCGKGNFQDAVALASKASTDIQQFSPRDELSLRVKLTECFVPYPVYHDQIKDFITASRRKDVGMWSYFFVIWLKTKDQVSLSEFYQAGLAKYSEPAEQVVLREAYAKHLFLIDRAEALDFIDYLEGREKANALFSSIIFSLQREQIPTQWEGLVESLEQYEALVGADRQDEDDDEDDSENETRVSTALHEIGDYAIAKQAWTEIAKIIQDTRLGFDHRSDLLQSVLDTLDGKNTS